MPKISSSLWGFREHQIGDAVAKIAAIGYEGIEIVTHELGTSVGYHLSVDFPESRIKEIFDLLSTYQLHVVAISPSSDFLVPRHGSLEGDIEHVKKNMDLAVRCNCALVRPFATYTKPEEMSTEKALEIIVDSFKKCAKYGEECGVKLAMENHGHFPSVYENFMAIVDGVASDYFGLTLHVGRRIDEKLETFADKIFHLHLTDQGRRPPTPVPFQMMRRIRVLQDQGVSEAEIAEKLQISEENVRQALAFRSPRVHFGEGIINFREIFTTLRKAGYDGWYNYEGSDADAEIAYKHIHNLLSELGID